VNPQYAALALLVFALVITRLWEENRWRDGRMSDRTAAILLVGRLPFLLVGFTLITGQDWPVIIGSAVVGIAIAAALYPWMVGRLRRSTVKAKA
jgi:hypothetical protein